MSIHNALYHHSFVHNSCDLVFSFHMVTKLLYAFFNMNDSNPYSIGKVVYHKYYRGIQPEYIRV